MAAARSSALWKNALNKFDLKADSSLFLLVSIWELASVWGYPPPPTPSKSLDGRGFCKNGLQNLERVGVRGQNLESKRVTYAFGNFANTSFAVAMICFSEFSVKVRCHNDLRKVRDSAAIIKLEICRSAI